MLFKFVIIHLFGTESSICLGPKHLVPKHPGGDIISLTGYLLSPPINYQHRVPRFYALGHRVGTKYLKDTGLL